MHRLKKVRLLGLLLWSCLMAGPAVAADTVPNEAQMPGTQPNEIMPLDTVENCARCHGGYDANVEPVHNWRGSMMAHAARDPIFWAVLAVAEQDFDGAGDVCIRCHNPGGWLEGRSTPTDGSMLSDVTDRDGVECDLCHRLTNPDESEHQGVQNPPFVANSGGALPEGNYGSGQYVLTQSNATKLGPYADAASPAHGTMQSDYHRSPELCGTCHDVSNPVVGDLAHNNGAQIALGQTGIPGDQLDNKAAFNHRPYEYGVVERTYSEHKASLLGATRVGDYPSLPADLQDGAIKRAYEAAMAVGNNGDYADGTPRYFSCQTCHMPPVAGKGAGRPLNGPMRPPVRSDVPKHDLTGGNYWMPAAIQYLDGQGRLRLGGGLTTAEIAAMNDGMARARSNLEAAASLSVEGNTLKVVNLTSHKLISGYPEGRRMWLNVQWFDADGNLLREDGAYGPITVDIDGVPTQVDSLLDLHDPNLRIYEAHGALTQEWANQLLDLGYDSGMVVAFDRFTGEVSATLQDVAGLETGTYQQSFHFILNNYVAHDTRIPPYGYSYDEAERRNALPVPKDQYGNPGPGGAYNYWDEVALNPPAGAETATIRLLFQPTSWEYVQFLYLANDGQNAFLADTGRDFLDAWLNTGMAEPHVMATATWTNTGVTPPPATNMPPTADFTLACSDLACSFDGSASSDPDGNITGFDWDFGDGGTATGSNTGHTYDTAGIYTTTLTVTDDGGATASMTRQVSVTTASVNEPPVASFTASCTDLACSLDASASSDPDGTIVSFSWDLGDGGAAAGAVVNHAYAAAGTYPVALTVTDDNGATATTASEVTVTAPPAAPAVMTVDTLETWTLDGTDALLIQTSDFRQGDRIGAVARILDDAGTAVAGATVTLEFRDAAGNVVQTAQGTSDADGTALGAWQTTAPRGRGRWATAGTPPGTYTAVVIDVVKDGLTLDGAASMTVTTFAIN